MQANRSDAATVAAASVDVSRRRKRAAAPELVRNVYVHAPFCARRCVYCDFAVEVDRSPDHRSWTTAVGRELSTLLGSGGAALASALDTLYVGGGTPSLLDPSVVGALAESVGRKRLVPSRLEWTMEANPESFDRTLAGRWATEGVNRVSLGVQSFSPSALEWMGRLHGPEDALSAVSAARSAGLSNLSVDLIFGLPDDVRRSWKHDLERALSLGVPHVSIYGLSVEPATPLARRIGEGAAARPRTERYRDEYLVAAEMLAAEGYAHYEVSNFARPGFESRHNRAYWDGSPYLGLGNGAHSYLNGRRAWNERDWQTYARSVDRHGSGREGEEDLAPKQRRLEAVWLGLRTEHGFDAASLGPVAARTAERWARRGLASVDDGTVRLSPEGWLQLDGLAVELDAAADTASPPLTRPRLRRFF